MSDSKNKKEAYQIVLDDLMLCDLFRGKYDAKHGASEHFMYGICTVMEAIACRISEKTGDAFSDIFILNMIKSEEKYEAMSKRTETHDLRTETHGVRSDELISRQEALEACAVSYYASSAYTRIEALPSVNGSGKWIERQINGTFKIWRCNKCGWNSEGAFNYCPHCGSRNIEEGREEDE